MLQSKIASITLWIDKLVIGKFNQRKEVNHEKTIL